MGGPDQPDQPGQADQQRHEADTPPLPPDASGEADGPTPPTGEVESPTDGAATEPATEPVGRTGAGPVGGTDAGPVGAEDVLAPPASTPAPAVDPAGASRTPTPPPAGLPRSWRRPADYAAVAVILVAVLVAGVTVWWFSDARATTLVTATGPAPTLAPPSQVPTALREVWRADSAATPGPVVISSTVVTANGGEVADRDPLTGQVRWSYTRDLALCTVAPAWGRVLAVYRKDTNCSEVTALDAGTGQRGPQRNGNTELGTRLLSDGVHVTATGGQLAEVWRSDLVKSLEYGTVPAIVNPGKQPRTECTYGSFAVTSGRVAVVERCPKQDQTDRLTVLKPNPEESDKPEVISTTPLPGKGGRVIAVSNTLVASAVPNPPRLVVTDAKDGNQLAEYPLALGPDDLTGDPAGWTVPVTTGAGALYWFTGSRTVALSLEDFRPVWTAEDTIGPGALIAGRLVVPVADGLRALDQASGALVQTVPVDRQGYQGQVALGSVGTVVLEQRGTTLVALDSATR